MVTGTYKQISSQNDIHQGHTVIRGSSAGADDRDRRRRRQPDRHVYPQLRAVQENVRRLL